MVEVSQANPARFLAVRQLLGVLPLDTAEIDAQLHAHIVSVKPSSGPSAPLSNATKARPDPSRFITPRPAPAAPASAMLASTMGGAVGASEAASASAAPMHAAAEEIVGHLDAAGLGSYTFKDLKRELGRRGFTVVDLDKAELKRVVAVAIRRRHRALGECAATRYTHIRERGPKLSGASFSEDVVVANGRDGAAGGRVLEPRDGDVAAERLP